VKQKQTTKNKRNFKKNLFLNLDSAPPSTKNLQVLLDVEKGPLGREE